MFKHVSNVCRFTFIADRNHLKLVTPRFEETDSLHQKQLRDNHCLQVGQREGREFLHTSVHLILHPTKTPWLSIMVGQNSHLHNTRMSQIGFLAGYLGPNKLGRKLNSSRWSTSTWTSQNSCLSATLCRLWNGCHMCPAPWRPWRRWSPTAMCTCRHIWMRNGGPSCQKLRPKTSMAKVRRPSRTLLMCWWSSPLWMATASLTTPPSRALFG